MRIAQITDLHVCERDDGIRRFVDTNAHLQEALEALAHHASAPDVVVVTGDLTESGTAREYSILREAFDGFGLPVYLIPGNHDVNTAFERACADRLPTSRADGHCSYAIDEHEVRLVGIDTTLPDRHDGVFPQERADWLDTVLGAEPDRPTFVFMHHPPFDTGIWWMDAVGMGGKERFAEVLSGHPQVRLVVCGHIHRSIQTQVAGRTVSVCPSTAHQVGLVLDPTKPPIVTDEPPAFQIHVHTGDGFVTHHAPLPWRGREFALSNLLLETHRE